MTEITDEDHAKVVDLHRIYGRKGLSNLLDVNAELVDRAISKQEIAKSISSGVKRYWKRWMQNCRPRALDGAQRSG